MALKRVSQRSVPDEVFDQVLGDVLGGELAPGQALPAERKLAEVLGVSRPAVREALQRLSQAGLIEVRQGDTTTVRDFRRHAGLDLLPRLLLLGGTLDLKVIASILEARLLVGREVAELAARRGGAALAPRLHEAVAALREEQDPVAQQRHALTYWEHVVDGADSIVFRLMFNSLRAAYEPALPALATMLAPEVGRVSLYQALADAIGAGDPSSAGELAAELLSITKAEFAKLEEDA
ncbi:FadR/GntR family transcriptional regulator [Labedaea rhizosphaerae]|uniref:GntR family transcriptional regulator n=1 Tax=Labedaea rhizosphaerae TaxID=598644 RepID=A0A4V3CZS9_LABRH|nr:GntR family transcriptional regulator [Labedaea rhizosphaerae]TDQ00861.1 GntR family transcriptional regulator [Labedaea rhizosphaerae]